MRFVVEGFGNIAAAKKEGHFCEFSDVEDSFDGKPVGVVRRYYGGGIVTGIPGIVEVPLDVAYLFAAAPEMLEFIEEILEKAHFDEYAGRGGREWFEKASKLIQKAKGINTTGV